MTILFREILGYSLILLNHFIKKPKKPDILSLVFHNPDKKIFVAILNWLVKEKYQFISIKQLEYYFQHKITNGKFAVITFDDGWNGNLILLETIEKYKVPVTLFIPTNSIQEGNYWWEYVRIKDQVKITGVKTVEEFKKLTEPVFSKNITSLKSNYQLKRSCIDLSQLKQLAKHHLITIGSHTVNHPILKKCSPEKQEIELRESKLQLDKWLHKKTDYFSYPNGDYNEDSIHLAKKTGYKLCFTTQPSNIILKEINPYLVPRFSINEKGGYYENISKISGMWYRFKTK